MGVLIKIVLKKIVLIDYNRIMGGIVLGFYNEFNKYYDDIFPAGKPQLEFLTKRIVGNNILDIACSTGNYSISLAKEGYTVSGIDLDEGMIEVFKKKAREEGVTVNALVGDMKKLQQYYKEESFETAFCIGNSLVHLTTLEEIMQVLKVVYQLLEKKGKMIIQIINYDRILKYNIEQLPTIENNEAGVSLVRNYVKYSGDDLIHFQTELRVIKENECYKNVVELYPLRKKELIEGLEKIGFFINEVYGNFKEEPYSDESYATVIVAEK